MLGLFDAPWMCSFKPPVWRPYLEHSVGFPPSVAKWFRLRRRSGGRHEVLNVDGGGEDDQGPDRFTTFSFRVLFAYVVVLLSLLPSFGGFSVKCTHRLD